MHQKLFNAFEVKINGSVEIFRITAIYRSQPIHDIPNKFATRLF